MSVSEENTPTQGESASAQSLVGRCKAAIAYLRAHKKELFWYWIAYQSIKGTITTSVIWIPLIYVWVGRS